ncbi:MAG: glycosyltransferase family 1 protein [Chloroflexi bacterium]|nr:glycosyltransferase family 1 protein [Chloroflexota bacterium]
MRIVILTIGTRGDVQPFVALARGLRAAGHDPLIVAPEVFAEFVRDAGVAFAPFPGDPAAFIQSLVDRGGSRLRLIREVMKFAMPIARDVLSRALAASRGADVILASFLLTIGGYQVARQLDVPFISAQLFPTFTPTRAFPMAGMPGGSPLANRLSHTISTALFWHSSRIAYQTLKRQAPEVPRTLANPFGPSLRTIYGFSRHVLPPPPDWDDRTRVTGYWFLDSPPDYTPPPPLAEFLAAGEPPVYIGFGSMVTDEAQRLSALVIDALRRTGRRAILLGGWGRFGGDHLPPHILQLDSAPHDWLFERVAVVVHHGGAGTTGASLRAGKPALIVPFTADQPFWGNRVAALGVGLPPIPHRRLTADALSAGIERLLTDRSMRERAAALGSAIRAEDGVGEAVRAIEALVGQSIRRA